MKIKYDGTYPNLCSGQLQVFADGKWWVFPDFCLSSGGGILFDDNWNEQVDEGPWTITNWPKDFPEDQKQAVEDAVNNQIPYGCCGGCI